MLMWKWLSPAKLKLTVVLLTNSRLGNRILSILKCSYAVFVHGLQSQPRNASVVAHILTLHPRLSYVFTNLSCVVPQSQSLQPSHFQIEQRCEKLDGPLQDVNARNLQTRHWE